MGDWNPPFILSAPRPRDDVAQVGNEDTRWNRLLRDPVNSWPDDALERGLGWRGQSRRRQVAQESATRALCRGDIDAVRTLLRSRAPTLRDGALAAVCSADDDTAAASVASLLERGPRPVLLRRLLDALAEASAPDPCPILGYAAVHRALAALIEDPCPASLTGTCVPPMWWLNGLAELGWSYREGIVGLLVRGAIDAEQIWWLVHHADARIRAAVACARAGAPYSWAMIAEAEARVRHLPFPEAPQR